MQLLGHSAATAYNATDVCMLPCGAHANADAPAPGRSCAASCWAGHYATATALAAGRGAAHRPYRCQDSAACNKLTGWLAGWLAAARRASTAAGERAWSMLHSLPCVNWAAAYMLALLLASRVTTPTAADAYVLQCRRAAGQRRRHPRWPRPSPAARCSTAVAAAQASGKRRQVRRAARLAAALEHRLTRYSLSRPVLRCIRVNIPAGAHLPVTLRRANRAMAAVLGPAPALACIAALTATSSMSGWEPLAIEVCLQAVRALGAKALHPECHTQPAAAAEEPANQQCDQADSADTARARTASSAAPTGGVGTALTSTVHGMALALVFVAALAATCCLGGWEPWVAAACLETACTLADLAVRALLRPAQERCRASAGRRHNARPAADAGPAAGEYTPEQRPYTGGPGCGSGLQPPAQPPHRQHGGGGGTSTGAQPAGREQPQPRAGGACAQAPRADSRPGLLRRGHMRQEHGLAHASPELTTACKAALAATHCEWHAVPNSALQQLAGHARDATYQSHMLKMKQHWCQLAAEGKLLVLHSTPEGKCFICSASLLLTGHEGYRTTLRLHTAIELVLHANDYVPRGRTVMVDLTPTDTSSRAHKNVLAYFREDLKSVATPDGWVPMGTAAHLAQVLGRPVHLYCPDCTLDDIRPFSQTCIVPSGASQHPAVTLSWVRCGWDGKGTIDNNNHYVPVVTAEGQHLGDIAHRAELQHRRHTRNSRRTHHTLKHGARGQRRPERVGGGQTEGGAPPS
jgi:hypothetical protein